jgi:DNA-binding protein H-NS
MAKETTYSGMQGDQQRLVTALTANNGELPHLEGARQRLENLLTQAQETAKKQAALTASKQETSKQLRSLVMEGQRVANAVRSMLKEHYGLRAEKLAEFGLQPFRGRARKVKPEAPAIPEPPTSQPTAASNSKL